MATEEKKKEILQEMGIPEFLVHGNWEENRTNIYYLLNSANQDWKHRKVLLVGEERVGKSSICKCLQGISKFSRWWKGSPSTDGIEVHPPLELNDGVTLSIWDFGLFLFFIFIFI